MASPSFYRRALPSGAAIGEWRAADGWVCRRFDWPAADPDHARGAILFQGGRGDVAEKYLELFALWHARGWAVTSFDWRGQGGSGRLATGQPGDLPLLAADLAEFWAGWRPGSPGPHVLVGHSMGGHVALSALLDARVAPDAAVLVAPMLGLASPVGARAGEAVARLRARLGDADRPAWQSDERPRGGLSRQSLLTHDRARYADELWWRLANPDHAIGPPSWAWLAHAFAETRALRRDQRLRSLDVPLMMLVARADRLVDARAALAVGQALPDCTTVAFGREAAHEILREADGVRDRAIAGIDVFLDERAPPA